MRAALLVALLTAAASAHAQQYGGQQYGGLYQARQNARAVSGQLPQSPSAYRATAARTGLGVPTNGGTVNQAKPFTHITRGPAISPYLNLFREEAENAAPNYHVFVQPQLQQQQQIQAQQQQLFQLQRRLQQTNQTPRVAGGARFGDTGRYYGGLRR